MASGGSTDEAAAITGVFSRKRAVRIHFHDDQPSLEGICLGQKAGHYVLAKVRVVSGTDDAVELSGEVWVPREKVLMLQVTR